MNRVWAVVILGTPTVTGCIGAGDMFAPEKSLVGPYTLFQAR
jgi:hypothetical protein